MKSVVFRGAYDVRIEDMPEPTIEQPLDAIVRITTTNICGSDLHPYEGRAPMEEGMILGHENTGVVVEVGQAVNRIRVGSRVSVPFNIACGTCRNCNQGFTSACLRANPTGMPGAGYGYPKMGPYQGGQAEFLRVPWADFNLLELPEGQDHEADFAMLSDIFPTGYHGAELAGVRPGSTVVVFGAGPVGLMAAHSSLLKGAAQVMVVDKEADRLALATKMGATAIDFTQRDVEDAVLEYTDGFGADCGIEAVGYQAHDGSGDEHPEMVLDNLVAVVRATGGLGIVGVYVSEDPEPATEGPEEGRYGFRFGAAFEKGLTIGTGQCPVKKYNRELRDLIVAGRANPGQIVSHELPREDAVNAYDQFDKRVDGWTKVLLHPAA